MINGLLQPCMFSSYKVNLFHSVLFFEDKLNAHLIIVKCKMERVLLPPPIEARCNRILFKKNLNTLRDQEF